MEEIKKKVVDIVGTFTKSDVSDEIIFWEKLLETYENDKDYKIIKSKVYNLLKLTNLTKKKSEEEFKKLLDRDLEDDIWYEI